MNEQERKILNILRQALPGMSEVRKAWLLGLAEGIAGEPGRTERECQPVERPRTVAGA